MADTSCQLYTKHTKTTYMPCNASPTSLPTTFKVHALHDPQIQSILWQTFACP